MIFCTVFDDTQRSEFDALLASLRRHHPGARVLALYTGDELTDPPDAEIVGVAEVPGGDWWRRVAITPSERRDDAFSGALLAEALRRDDRAVYLSTRMRVLRPLDPITSELETSDLALVPMLEGPLPDDGLKPKASMVARAGRVNRRIIAARRSALAGEFLEAWPEHADHEPGEKAPAEFSHDLLTDHFERFADRDGVALISHPGVGYAYWNAPLREATESAGELVVGGAPLVALDMSGIRADEMVGVWHFQERVALEDNTPLARLLLELADEIWQRYEYVDPPYAHDARGRFLDFMYRELLREAIAAGRVDAAPWTAEGGAQWDAWLSEPAPRGGANGITREQHAVWLGSQELRKTFPDLDGEDGADYARLLAARGPDRLLSLPEEITETKFPWGVNVAGFFRSQLGLGEAARLLMTSLDAAEVPALAVHGRFVPQTADAGAFAYTAPTQTPYPINIVCLNGEQIPPFAQDDPEFFRGRYTIAMWWWELVDAFPEDWLEAFPHIDEVWVATDHVHDAIAPHSPVPVNKVRMPVLRPQITPHSRTELGMPQDGFVFLYIYDYFSTASRKNPLGHVEAFKRAFPEGSGAKLVLKCINGSTVNSQHLPVLLAIDGHPDITVIDEFVSAEVRDAMIANCDCYLSLHRSEGFGLTPAEAMALGKPVIATRYGGVLDFMTDENSWLVDHGWTTVGKEYGPYPPGARWADPDLDHAARLMREVFENPEAAKRRGERAARDIAERHSPAVTGGLIRERLAEIHRNLHRYAAHRAVPAEVWDREETVRRIQSQPPVSGRARALKAMLRKATGRAIAPHLAREKGIDEHLLRGIDYSMEHERQQTIESLRRIHALEQRIAELERDAAAREDAAPRR